MSITDKLGLGPKREEATINAGVRITVTPPIVTGLRGNSVDLNNDQYDRYLLWRAGSLLIQDALPELSDADREILMTGIGPNDFEKLSSDE